MRFTPCFAAVFYVGFSLLQLPKAAMGDQWQVGVGKMEITPTEPLRLSGYSNRVESHTAVADPLHVRVLSLACIADDSAREAAKPLVLVSVDSIAVSSNMTIKVAEWLAANHGVPRSHLVISSTHSHTAPHPPLGLDNLFKELSSEQQVEASKRYQDQVLSATIQAIDHALRNTVQGARVEIGESSADFAVQRRVIRDGRWENFGVQEGGQVDHRVHVMRVRATDGSLIAASYQYACHCTTLGPDFNQISGDWAGLSASRLEELNPGAVFLPIIGCGADANPEPRTSYEAAVQHSMQMVDAVKRVLESKDLAELPAPSKVQFGMVGLEPEHPTQDQLKKAVESSDPNEVRWAKKMQQIRLAMGRLPESIPLPVHVWTFGDLLSWVFMGGEVVVDYQFTIEKELPTQKTWVAAYCDDVPGYVASESQRPEGGYEVDYSMIFYMQPGRWKSGTQSNILTRVREISQQERGEDQPLDPQAALQSMVVPEQYRIELVASEPLVQDPVNVAFGWDGRVWVVQMSDYPQGKNGGSVRVLVDENQDGIPEVASTFLSGLSYPTSVHPWRHGVLIVAAPNVLLAEDTDGDMVADKQSVLLSGIGEVNPQHRASGFEIGLDGRLHFAVGDGTRELFSHVNGQTYRVQGHDVAWNPDTGEIELVVNGTTQFVPARDSFGNWFGNHNNKPMFQFVFQSKQLDGHSLDVGNVHHLLSPAEAPPVFPRSRTIDRFNDLYSRDRYTSACGAIIVRSPGLQPPAKTMDSNHPVALVCEPVHNLVARIQLRPDGSVFSADRHPEDQKYDFIASTDPWSRPVRAVNAPDGSIWVLDMYRYVIEHPQWIPMAWQSKIDLRAGEGLGRIYRVYHRQYQPGIVVSGQAAPQPSLNLASYHPMQLLLSPTGALRDMATQAIVTDQVTGLSNDELEAEIRESLGQSHSPEVIASLLGVLAGKNWLRQSDLTSVLKNTQDSGLVSWALHLVDRYQHLDEPLKTEIESIPHRDLGAAVDLQWVLSSRRWTNLSATNGLLQVLNRGQPDRWLSAALTLLDSPQTAEPVVQVILDGADRSGLTINQMSQQLTTLRRLLGLMNPSQCRQLFASRCTTDATVPWSQGKVMLMAALSDFQAQLADPAEVATTAPSGAYEQLVTQAVDGLLDGQQPEVHRERLSVLLGSKTLSPELESSTARQLLGQGSVGASLAIQRLRYLSDDSLAAEVLKAWTTLGYQDQALAASSLMARQPWREALISSLESGAVHANHLPPAVVQSLTSHYDRNLRSRAVAVLGRPSPRQNVVSEYLTKMPNPMTHGDATRGAQWYREQCAVCHTGQDGKTAIGPPIENLSHWNNEQWITALMDPSQAVEEKFKQTVILTVDQEVISGIVVEETASQLKVAGSDGTIRQVNVDEIEDRRQSNVSLMPDGLEAKVSPNQLADIIRYLRSR